MNITLDIKGQGKQEAHILEGTTCQELKEICARAAFCAPSCTRVYFNGKLVMGDDLIEEIGIEEGSVVNVEPVGL